MGHAVPGGALQDQGQGRRSLAPGAGDGDGVRVQLPLARAPDPGDRYLHSRPLEGGRAAHPLETLTTTRRSL